MTELLNLNNPFFNIFEKLPQSIFIIHKSKFLYINPKGLDFFNCRLNDIKEINIEDFFPPESQFLFNDNFNNKKLKEKLNIKIIDCKKKEKWVEISLIPIDWNGLKSILYSFNDISALKETEKNLKKIKKNAIESDKLKSSFLANMSHEIRTPLNAIIGFSQLLSQDDVSTEIRQRYYSLIDNNSRQLLDLIDDIIDLTKIEAGQIKINKSDFNVNQLIKELKLNFNNNLDLFEKTEQLSLLTKTPINSDNIILHSDKQKLLQVFNNLVSNAIKFTRKGQIIIGYRILDSQFLQFYVKDSGIGIPEEKQKLIFNRFQQLSSTHSPMTKGTGLGLTISQNIVQLLGGELSVKSEYGKGSTFLFTIPFKEIINKPIIEPTKKVQTFIDWSNKIIVLAEDEESNYFFIQEVLRKTKAQLIWAKDGQELIDILQKNNHIDLILMDIQMPRMNGYQAIKKIKELGYNTPIIAQTAYAMIEEKEEILSLGFDSYISKPIQINLLINTISNFI